MTEETAQRIAAALERIADRMERPAGATAIYPQPSGGGYVWPSGASDIVARPWRVPDGGAGMGT